MKTIKKAIKITLCTIVLIAILTANVFASGWSDFTPNYVSIEESYFPENITSIQSTETLKELVDNAYKLGLFGGSMPFAVLTNNDNDVYSILILCCSPFMLNNQSGIYPEKEETYGNIVTTQTVTSIEPSEPNLIAWCGLLNNGDIYTLNTTTKYELNSNEKMLLIRSPEGEWYYDDTSIFAQSGNVDNTENATLKEINEKYQSALANSEVPPQPPIIQNYILDIPSIITAIPNGAKQIVNNAFGFEIFGINVAGLLSVLLVVTIVAFVIKWLMSR